MSANICYEKGSNEKDYHDTNDVRCDVREDRQNYRNVRVSRAAEKQHHIKYVNGRENGDDDCYSRRADETRPRRSQRDRAPKSNADSIPSPLPKPSNGASNERCEANKRYDDHDYDGRLKHCASRNSSKPLPAHCYELPRYRKPLPCTEKTRWQNGKYCRDECGSGIIPQRFDYHLSHRIWCRTPLTTYQASHGELGKQILCGEKVISRTIGEGPPCNVCEYILPPCRGYYRKYDCFKPCANEDENYVYENGRNRLRDKVERYWGACAGGQERKDFNTFAPQNMALALKLRRKAFGITCW